MRKKFLTRHKGNLKHTVYNLNYKLKKKDNLEFLDKYVLFAINCIIFSKQDVLLAVLFAVESNVKMP